MRLKLTLTPLDAQPEITFSYQYALSSCIYKIISTADKAYSEFLHSQGFRVPGKLKTFKDFSFSGLDIPRMDRPAPGDTAIRVRSREIYLSVSFYADRSAENFVMGLFENQKIEIFNRDHRAEFHVSRVETLAPAFWEEAESGRASVIFEALSPMVIAEKDGRGIDP